MVGKHVRLLSEAADANTKYHESTLSEVKLFQPQREGTSCLTLFQYGKRAGESDWLRLISTENISHCFDRLCEQVRRNSFDCVVVSVRES
jgi:hypothetical protein